MLNGKHLVRLRAEAKAPKADALGAQLLWYQTLMNDIHGLPTILLLAWRLSAMIRSLTAATLLTFSLTTPALGQTQSMSPIVDVIIQRANDSFRRGMLNLKDGKREDARADFDDAITVILESGVDVRSNKQLETFYEELIEKIYREEVTQSGFQRQLIPPVDRLSKLLLTDAELQEADKKLARMDDLNTHYDRFEDKTTAWVPYDRVQVKNLAYQYLRVTAFFTYRGKVVGTPVERMGLMFRSSSSDWTYLKSSELIAIVDGERLPLGRPVARDSNVSNSYGGVQVEEVLEFKLEYLELKKIALARRVEMRLGPAEFEFDSSFLRSLRRLISHLTLPAKSAPAKNNRRRAPIRR